jgi:trimethylamine--corrinoid protein Co-methyltransferase
MLLAVQTLTDKPYLGAVITGEAARDSIAMTDMLFGGGNDAAHPEARVFAVVNANSPLRFDTRMLEAMMVYAEAAQVNVITPFLLMGAMAPVSTPAALVQQTTEALAGLCLTQLVRPGAPVILGSFLSHTDMQSGSPGFGGPESALGLLASGQIARRFGVPWRAGGGFLTSSQTPDAQAAYEGLNTMLPAFLAGANYVEHAAGWLESGLVASFEKFIVDIEMLRVLKEEFRPMEIDEDALAFGAHQEVGYGGHFFGAAHTLERFRDCFYRPLLSSTENFERWKSRGGQDAAQRAGVLWREVLERYEQPAIDPGLRDQLEAFVARRRAELGD